MIYFLGVLCILVLLFFLAYGYAENLSILYLLTLSFTWFCMQYLIISIFFLWINYFLVEAVLTTMLLFNIVMVFIYRRTIRSKCDFKFHFDAKETRVLFFVLLLIPLVFGKSEDIRTSSDMGMYFEKMVSLIEDNNGITLKLEEMGLISENVDKGVLTVQEQLSGISIRELDEEGNIVYDYHALPTWVTLMALFAKMFGVYNGAQALTFMYVLSVLLCYYICQKIGKDVLGKSVAIIFYAICPVIIYLAKCTYTEITYVYILYAAIFFLVEKQKLYIWMAGVCFGMLPFIHTTTYVYLPALCICLYALSMIYPQRKYGQLNIICLASFILSLLYSHKVSYAYVKAQIGRLHFLGDTFREQVLALAIICGIGIIIQVLTIFFGKIVYDKVQLIMKKVLPIVFCIMIATIVFGSIYHGYLLAFTDKYISGGGGTWWLRELYANNGFASLAHLNIINIMKASGFICLPFVFGYIILRKDKENIVQNILIFILLYSIIIYTVVNIDTPNNYYASRYFAFTIIPIFTLLMSTIITNSIVYKAILLWYVIYAVRYDYLFVSRVAFGGQYEVLSDVKAAIPEGGVVLVRNEDTSTNQILIHNLRKLNNNLVFNYENIDEVRTYFDEEAVYLISKTQFDSTNNNLLLYEKYQLYGNLSGENVGYMTEKDYVPYFEDVYIYLISN